MTKPSGRSLGDFKGALLAGEAILLRQVANGELAVLPATASVVRAGLVRFLALGGDDEAPVHENGVRIQGARILETLDLNDCKIERSVDLRNCKLLQGLILTDAQLVNLGLKGTEIHAIPGRDGRAISADRMRATGSVFIREGARVLGGTRLLGASIDGDLDLAGSEFNATNGIAIDATAATIGGDLELRDHFLGPVPLPGAASPGVDFPLLAQGQVCLDGAQIGGRLRIVGGDILRPWAQGAGTAPKADVALSCIGMSVKRGFFFSHHTHGNSRVDGVWLLGATVGVLVDDLQSWGPSRPTCRDRLMALMSCNFAFPPPRENLNRFDGFQFERIADESPRRAAERLAWLRTQHPSQLGAADGAAGHIAARAALRSQPWRQVASALDNLGEFTEAKTVRIELQRQVTQVLPWRSVWQKTYRFLYDVLCGYGYGTGRLLMYTVLFWLVGAAAVSRLAIQGNIYPTDAKLRDSAVFAQCLQKTRGTAIYDATILLPVYCRAAAGQNYPRLYPLLYSLDNMTPLIDFGQKKAWQPRSGKFWSGILIAQYMFGIVAASTLLGLLGSLVVRKSG